MAEVLDISGTVSIVSEVGLVLSSCPRPEYLNFEPKFKVKNFRVVLVIGGVAEQPLGACSRKNE